MRLSARAISFLVLMLLSTFAFAGDITFDSTSRSKTGYLFVLSAISGTLDGNTLTLNSVPNVIYFSDRPYRVAGHISVDSFVEKWNKGADSFKTDPPNATLSILTKDGQQTAVVELKSIKQKNGVLYFKIAEQQGEISESFDTAVLFIDLNKLPLFP